MKTAMQELIEWIEQRFNNPQETEVFKKATELLEKEKQKMFHCFNAGADRVCDKEFNQWFDKTYTQNK